MEEDKYCIVRLLGKGGMGAVYQVWDKRLKKMWAMKVVAIPKEKQGELKYRQMKSEINLLKQLSHPLLPQIVDMVRTADYIGMIMEYIEGITLAEYLEKHQTVPQKEAVHFGAELAEVLAYLHGQRPPIIYGDMKPSNIMMRADGSLKLIDFGTAVEYRMEGFASDAIYGTYGYAAPEQGKEGGERVDSRSDIYGLGTTLYHMVTGQNPSKPPYTLQPVRNSNPALSEGLEQIICRCTKVKKKERYQSCEACRTDLLRYRTLEKKRVWSRKIAYVGYYLLLLATVAALWSKVPGIAIPMLLFALAGRIALGMAGRKEQFILYQKENILLTEKRKIGLPIS